MVKVIIELHPHGLESAKRTIGEIVIANDGTGDVKHGNYRVALKHAGRFFGKPGYWREGKVNRHSRNLSPYHLVLKALEACLKGE